MQIMYTWQDVQSVAVVYTDADWAGDKDARKFTTGGCIVIGRHLIKGWAKTQSLIALSSAESELYATLKASAETLGIIAMARGLGCNLKGQILGDASVALGIIHRPGLGKARHIDISYLSVQEVAAQRRLLFSKVLGKENPADLYTKYLDAQTSDKHVTKLGCRYTAGRSSVAPQLHSLSKSWCEYMAEQDSYGLYKLEKASNRSAGENADHTFQEARQCSRIRDEKFIENHEAHSISQGRPRTKG